MISRYKRHGGWYNESYRHYLAAKGVKTGRATKVQPANLTVKMANEKPSDDLKVNLEVVDDPTKDKDFLVVVKTPGKGRKDVRIPDDQIKVAKEKLKALGVDSAEDLKQFEQTLARGMKEDLVFAGRKIGSGTSAALKRFKKFREQQYVKQGKEVEDELEELAKQQAKLEAEKEEFRREQNEMERREQQRLRELAVNP
jgi:hypothetical protein